MNDRIRCSAADRAVVREVISMSEKDIIQANEPEEFDEEANIVVMTDEDGNEVEFEFIDLVEYEGEKYVILLPADEDDDSGEVVILRLEESEEDEETESYVGVDDDDILEAVFAIFKERFQDVFEWQE